MAFYRDKRLLRAAAAVVTITVIVATVFRILGVNLVYDSSDRSATPGMTLLVALVALIGGSSLLMLLQRMFSSWKSNHAPDVWEKILWLIVLITVPYGPVIYYWFVYRRMDGGGQYRLF